MALAVVVDDSRLMRRMIRTVLETAGYTVVCEAKSGEQAVQRYLEYYPQIVTMDITMPGMDSMEATRNILERDKNAKIVMVTAMATSFQLEDAYEAGASGCVVKPFSPTQCVRPALGCRFTVLE